MKRYTCTGCGWRFYDKVEAEQHLKDYKNKHKWCKFCGLFVWDIREGIDHINEKHIDKETGIIKDIDPEFFRRLEEYGSTTRMCLVCLEDLTLDKFQTIEGRCVCLTCWYNQPQKICEKCELQKPLSEFKKLLTSEREFKGSYSKICKRCQNKKQKCHYTPRPPSSLCIPILSQLSG